MRKKIRLIGLIIILLSFLLGAYFYSAMPARIATHWGLSGQVNGYTDNHFWGVFLLPVVELGLWLLLLGLPLIDPLRSNIEKFRKYYDNFSLVLVTFLFYLYVLSLWWNLQETKFNMVRFLVPAFAVLIFYLGILMKHAERNWFIGIRTPWTLSSDKVWRKTHALGGKLFQEAAIVSLLGFMMTDQAVWLMTIPLALSAFFSVVYSYWVYRQEILG